VKIPLSELAGWETWAGSVGNEGLVCNVVMHRLGERAVLHFESATEPISGGKIFDAKSSRASMSSDCSLLCRRGRLISRTEIGIIGFTCNPEFVNIQDSSATSVSSDSDSEVASLPSFISTSPSACLCFAPLVRPSFLFARALARPARSFSLPMK
jgi:hypothetical protein